MTVSAPPAGFRSPAVLDRRTMLAGAAKLPSPCIQNRSPTAGVARKRAVYGLPAPVVATSRQPLGLQRGGDVPHRHRADVKSVALNSCVPATSA